MPHRTIDDEPLRRLLAEPFASPAAIAAEHVDPEIIALHASSELDPDDAMAVARHLAACDDGRCLTLLRELLAGASRAREALYGPPLDEPSSDPAPRTTPRHGEHTFECRDALWETFEALAREEGCSVDTLIAEAMRAFAQQRSVPVAPISVRLRAAPELSASGNELDPPRERNTPTLPRAYFTQGAPLDPPRERNTPTLPRSYLPSPRPARRASTKPSPPSALVPPSAAPPRLALLVNGVYHGVTKARFVIGRGPSSSDLAILGPDVSRQHALIELVDGSYHLVDMGSTNGIEHEGERVARWPITHGDRVRIGEHEIEFVLLDA